MSDLWLKHVRQEGMVVSRAALHDVPLAQDAADTEEFAASKADFWQIADRIFRWPADLISPKSADPQLCTKRLTELNVTLSADAAILDADKTSAQLLVRLIGASDPDRKEAIEGWEGITEQQAFERLLRETGVSQGVLVTDNAIRLTYAPPGETPGFLEWPLRGMETTAGRPMLGGLKLLLGRNALWGGEESRLSEILKRSRDHQNTVSTSLAEQVLGALYILMRGFTSGIEAREAMRRLSDKDPQHVYEGLLAVLLRLVFVLYAEDRDLIPSREDEEAKRIYDRGYSVRDLFARLEEDRAQHPDTMHDRYGAWGRLLALFRLIYNGAGADFMHARRGKLFDPDSFSFLEGRFEEDAKPDVLPISDASIHEVLTQLLILNGERLSYKTLDVEQIGSVYETVMGFVVTRTRGQAIALKVKTSAGSPSVPAFVELDKLLSKAGKDRKKFLKDTISFEVSDAQNKSLKAAEDIPNVLAALDRSIDERASPSKQVAGPGTIVLQPTDERRRSSSHYTPRSLTAPIVADALMPVLDTLSDEATPDDVLAIKMCDPAMGSGAFLVEACRALGERLEQAWKLHPELLPDEARDDPHVFARREVARRCLYGVDKNAMATDLAKLSLWLITLARDEDFSFLDHALKTGDSLIGLSVEQIKRLTWEDVEERTRSQFMFARAFDKAVDEAIEKRRAIRSAPDNITFEIQATRLASADKALDALRLAGDATIGVFFTEKKAKDRANKLQELHAMLPLGGDDGWTSAKQYADSLKYGDHPIRPFHWEIEFPEVFAGSAPGFDAIVGNPPFAGKNTIANGQRDYYPDWLKIISPGSHGNADLVSHFFRRAYNLIREGGTFGLIATNTIGQGDTRESGLRHLLVDASGTIYRAERRVKWPGAAAVVVSTVHVGKGKQDWPNPELDSRPVSRISAFLREGGQDETPSVLEENAGIAFIGSYVLGMGFTFDDVNAAKGKCEPLAKMYDLIDRDPRNAERIKPYLGGEEVNTDPEHRHHRFVIDFENFPLKRDHDLILWSETTEQQRKDMLREGIVPGDYNSPVAADWPDLLEIVDRLVKPERKRQKDKIGQQIWWRYLRNRPALYERILGKNRITVRSLTSTNFPTFTCLENAAVLDQTLVVWAEEGHCITGVLCSSTHEVWARTMGATMKDDGRYNVEDCFDTFPLAQSFREDTLVTTTTQRYFTHRAAMMKIRDEGLTKTYNRFHNPLEADEDIQSLRQLHAEMDDAVLRAYGWDDLADRCERGGEFAPRFLTEEEEPEFAYQNRLFWPASFRDKVIARLLTLNKERAAAEALMSKGDKKKKATRQQKRQTEKQGSLL